MKNQETAAALVRFKNELCGATAAAIISIPMAIGYGVTVFAPLGPYFAAQSALIGLNAAIIGGLVAALFGGTPGQISGPQASLTMVLTTVAAQLLTDPSLPQDPASRNYAIVSLVSFCVLIGGLTQLLLGFFRLGNLIKYIPHTVLSGFLNGIAILLVWKQLPLLLGLDHELGLPRVLFTPSALERASLLVGLAALGAVFFSRVFLKRLPSLVVGLAAGIAVCGLLPLISVDTARVATVGDLSAAAPTMAVFHELLAQLPRVLHYDGIYDLCGYGVVLGMLGSMESLMSSSALEGLGDTRADSNRELVGQGLGNVTASLFGSISSAGSIIRSHANVRAGGRGCLSGALCSAVMLLCVWTVAPLIGKIPLSIFAGLIISVGLTLFDWSIFRFLKFYRPPFGLQRDVLIGFLVHACVVVVTVAVSLTTAVLVGIVLSTAYFIVKMGMTSIRRRYSGTDITSRRIRNSAQGRCLQEKGETIRIFELQGPIFFGSADKLTRAIEAGMGEATTCILDMHHVSDIDTTGAEILLRLYKRLTKSGRQLLISHLQDGQSRRDFLIATGVLGQIDARHLFPDTDAALEWAEERILADLCLLDAGKRYRLREIEVLQGLSVDELTVFEQFLDRRAFKKGDAIISEGRADRDLLMLTHGLVRISLHLPSSNRQRRLFTLGAGTIIGEMALLDGSLRSADVWAEENSEFYRLTFEGYQKICADHPRIALKLVTNIALVISQRLRVRSQELRMLVDK